MTSNASNKGNHPLIARLEAIVLEHLDAADFDVETFADLSGLSRSELYRKIKKHTGKSVTEFVRDIRLHKALEYLKDEERTASEVAYLVGFSSATYFNKCFKDKFGFTPGEASYHGEKIKELLKEGYEEPKRVKPKSLFSKPRFILVLIVGITLIAWSLSNSFKFKEPAINQKDADLSIDGVSNINKLSVAALPFLNRTGNSENDYISYVATIEIIKSLNKIDSISRVPSMHSVMHYKDSVKTKAADLIKQLQVDYILQGYLIGNEAVGFQILLELFDARDNQIWTKNIVYDNTKVAKLYHDFNQAIKELSITLGFDTVGIPGREANTTSTKAYEYYAKALYQANLFTEEGWRNGITLFEKAIEEDPKFIDAYLELAEMWMYGGMNWAYNSQEVGWTNSQELFNKVLNIDPGNFEAKVGLSNGYFYFDLNVSDTIPEYLGIDYDEWIIMRPDHAEKTGRHEISLKSNLEWLRRDPRSSIVNALISINYYFLNQRETAMQKMDENYILYKDDLNFLREASKVYYFLGEYEKMEEAVLHFFETFENERPPIIRWLRAIVADKNNDQTMVKEQLQHLLNSYQNRESGSPAWFLALFHAYKNDVNKTLDWLERSYEAREVEMTWLAQEPDLHIVGDQPRYRALLDSMNFPESARRHVIFKD